MIYCDNLVIGSTFFAVGFALKNKNTLIIDKASRLGYEYMDSFDNSFVNTDNILSKEAQILYHSLKVRNIISESHKPIISAYASVLSEIVADNNINVLFKTVIIDVIKTDEGYNVKISNADGITEIKCKRIIDTTANNYTNKSLNALLIRNNENEAKNDRYELVSGEKRDVMYLKFFLENNCNLQEARKELYKIVRNELHQAKLVQTAYEFEYYYDTVNTSSDSYKNPILSFNAGLIYNEKEEYYFDSNITEEEYDVVVCGLGTAGAIAAVTSSEAGLKTLGLETEAFMGGIPTAGQVLGYYYGAKGGRFEKTDEKAYKNKDFAPANKVFFDHLLPDAKVEILENESDNVGAQLKFRAFVYDVIKKENKVIGLKYVCDNRLYEVKCKYVIDATGEADICALAGAETIRGREGDSKVQPFSICTMTVDKDTVKSYYCDNGYLNPNCASEYAKTVIDTYTQKMFLKEKYDNETFFSVISPMPGTREGRHIKAVKNISFTDFLEGFKGTKPLFYAYSNMDTHGTEHAFESDIYIEWAVVSRLRKKVFAVPVSTENLIPESVDGIVAAGKGIGVEHDISPCVRMKRDMQKCGEAAAKLVYMSIKNNCSPLQIDYDEIKSELEKTGCLEEENNKTEFNIGKLADGTKICVEGDWYEDAETIHEKLKDEKLSPIAVFSAVKLGINEKLKEWLGEEDASYNAALALGLLNDKSALPVIRKRVKEHPLMDTSSNRDDLLCDMSAIYLAAKLEDKESVEDIIGIFEMSKNNEIRNQYLFFSINAIRKFFIKGFISRERYVKLINSIENVNVCLSFKEEIYDDITSQIKNYMKEVL